MAKGFLNIVLHAHLPYVRHPEHDSFFEENWLFEAMTECYIPLINMLDRLQKDAVDYRLTLSLSPTLITMLRDELLQSRYVRHLNKQIELAEKEVLRTRQQPQLYKLARLYRRFFLQTRHTYQNSYQGDLLSAFSKHQRTGKLALITCAATHGFLPLLSISETAVRTQIKVGVDIFSQQLGIKPDGFWLPECGYYPGLEAQLKAAGIRYFFVDTHSLLNANPPQASVYAPVDCGNGVAAFARDPDSSQQVWSSKQGYPGDFDYREYYRDIGFDLDLAYIAPYILDGKTRSQTGIKYYRVTGDDNKELYQPKAARAKAKLHAQDFIAKRQQQINETSAKLTTPPVITAPYDAELFGHWWFEGPIWLEQVLRLTSASTSEIQTISASGYLQQQANLAIATPSASTWGDKGYSSYWINDTNAWVYPFLYQASTQMENFVNELAGLTLSAIQERALNQAIRSILLAQASDWPFIMKSGTTSEYATKRVTDALARFNYLYDCVRKGKIDERYLASLEFMDQLFPDIDFRDYRNELATK